MKTQQFSWIKTIGYGLLVLIITMAISHWDKQWDLTPDQRYTLNPMVFELTQNLDEPIVVTSYLEGQIPASFRNYKDYIDYFLSEIRRRDRNVIIEYRNPVEGDDSVEFRRFLSSQGVEPIRRQVTSTEEVNSNLLYPYLSVNNSRQIVFINLLEPLLGGQGEEESLVESQLAFEGKFLRGLKQIVRKRSPEVHVLGYRPDLMAEGFNRDPSLDAYRFVPSDGGSLLENKDSLDAVLVILKGEDLRRNELLAVDVLAGFGKPVTWLIDKFDITLDSLRHSGNHLAVAKEFNVEDYLFKMGLKIQPNLVMDLQASRIPQVVNDGSSTPQYRMMQYPFHPLLLPGELAPPVTKLSAPLSLYYVSAIETSEFPKTIEKTTLLTTSPYTRIRTSPVTVNFGFMQVTPDPMDYQEGNIPLCVELKGRTQPYYTNRITSEDKQFLSEFNLEYSADSQYIQQVVISDADFIIPAQGPDGRLYPIGYNPAERQMYQANTQLLGNILEYLIDGDEILALANRTSDLTILDKQRYDASRNRYLVISLVLPLVLLLLSYLFYHWWRKRRYAS